MNARRIKLLIVLLFLGLLFHPNYASAATPQVAAGRYHTVGLRSDGTVVAVGYNWDGQCNVGDWSGIVQVAAGLLHTVGLRSDGTAVVVGWNDYGQCNVHDWSLGTVMASGGLRVSIGPSGAVAAGAQWKVDGGPWHGSGAIQYWLSVGQHTVQFKTIEGWSRPSNKVVTISEIQLTEV